MDVSEVYSVWSNSNPIPAFQCIIGLTDEEESGSEIDLSAHRGRRVGARLDSRDGHGGRVGRCLVMACLRVSNSLHE